ncbi:hypothetical protein [Limnoglobus roseus]|uniref:hypothetical protein n=1 Tax=Limnoglobus roseus TaxID=2598579 RepID=UPI00143D585B|nr:hypothetical protein [Limnoglobus roseus]
MVTHGPDGEGKIPFGGVKHDMAFVREGIGGGAGKAHHPAGSGQSPGTLAAFVCAADLPFSLVGDIVTWPYTKAYTRINEPIPYPPVTMSALPPLQGIPIPPPPAPDTKSAPVPTAPSSQPMPLPVPTTKLPTSAAPQPSPPEGTPAPVPTPPVPEIMPEKIPQPGSDAVLPKLTTP